MSTASDTIVNKEICLEGAPERCMEFDPFRIVTGTFAFPGALPPATNFVPFRDKGWRWLTPFDISSI